jgi:O-antigen/teichoic acid export membrane protein
MFVELMSYTGWSLFGNISSVVKNQGINMLLNLYFGPVVNAASAIAFQIYYAVLSFAQNFTTAVRPQIFKSYAAGKKQVMLKLMFFSSKATFFLLFVIFLPLQLELQQVLELWLNDVPSYVYLFTQIILIGALLDSISYPLMSGSQATGKIRLYQVVVGGITLMNLPICLIILTSGGAAESVFFIGVLLAVLAYIARVLIISQQLEFSPWDYIKAVVLPVFIASLVGSIAPVIFTHYYPSSFARILMTSSISVVSIVISVFYLGLSKNERLQVIHIFWKYIRDDIFISFRKKNQR